MLAITRVATGCLPPREACLGAGAAERDGPPVWVRYGGGVWSVSIAAGETPRRGGRKRWGCGAPG